MNTSSTNQAQGACFLMQTLTSEIRKRIIRKVLFEGTRPRIAFTTYGVTNPHTMLQLPAHFGILQYRAILRVSRALRDEVRQLLAEEATLEVRFNIWNQHAVHFNNLHEGRLAVGAQDLTKLVSFKKWEIKVLVTDKVNLDLRPTYTAALQQCGRLVGDGPTPNHVDFIVEFDRNRPGRREEFIIHLRNLSVICRDVEFGLVSVRYGVDEVPNERTGVRTWVEDVGATNQLVALLTGTTT